jgi:2-keto-4-pentenoate hydratase/2-oxohepta-3-ene-1,7-dioic acid hydratase in catechol pathway
MKWVKFSDRGQVKYGFLDGETVKVTNLTWKEVLHEEARVEVGRLPLASIQPLNPIDWTGKIVCIGLNYMDHIRETKGTPPARPLIFTKFNTSMTDPGAAIEWSAELTNQVDFEAELAVIIGKTARRVSEAEALAYVAGYTCANDVSARDVQMGDGQWIRGKSLDTFCPMGPYFVTADEILDPQALAIRCMLNGVVMQDSSTHEMIFGVAHLISFCSQAFTLEPGDVILTGTPNGVGMGRKPPIWMQNGDTVVVEVEKIGRLENYCRVV